MSQSQADVSKVFLPHSTSPLPRVQKVSSHLGQYPSMTRSEYLSSTNAASIAGIVATKGRAHGVNCAALVSW